MVDHLAAGYNLVLPASHVRSARSSLALVALLGLLVPLPWDHAHEAWEWDLAPHDHQGGAVMLTSVEDCDGSHLHTASSHEHEACPACIVASTNVSAVSLAPSAAATAPERRTEPTAPAAAPRSLPSGIPAGRAPPAA